MSSQFLFLQNGASVWHINIGVRGDGDEMEVIYKILRPANAATESHLFIFQRFIYSRRL